MRFTDTTYTAVEEAVLREFELYLQAERYIINNIKNYSEKRRYIANILKIPVSEASIRKYDQYVEELRAGFLMRLNKHISETKKINEIKKYVKEQLGQDITTELLKRAKKIEEQKIDNELIASYTPDYFRYDAYINLYDKIISQKLLSSFNINQLHALKASLEIAFDRYIELSNIYGKLYSAVIFKIDDPVLYPVSDELKKFIRLTGYNLNSMVSVSVEYILVRDSQESHGTLPNAFKTTPIFVNDDEIILRYVNNAHYNPNLSRSDPNLINIPNPGYIKKAEATEFNSKSINDVVSKYEQYLTSLKKTGEFDITPIIDFRFKSANFTLPLFKISYKIEEIRRSIEAGTYIVATFVYPIVTISQHIYKPTGKVAKDLIAAPHVPPIDQALLEALHAYEVEQQRQLTAADVERLFANNALLNVVNKAQHLKYPLLIDLSVNDNECVPDLFIDALLFDKHKRPRIHKKKSRYDEARPYTREETKAEVKLAIFVLFGERDIKAGFTGHEIIKLSEHLDFEYIKIYNVLCIYEIAPRPVYEQTFERKHKTSALGGLSVVITNKHVYRWDDKKIDNDKLLTVHPSAVFHDKEKWEYLPSMQDLESTTFKDDTEYIYTESNVHWFHKRQLEVGICYPIISADKNNHVTSFEYKGRAVKYVDNFKQGLKVAELFNLNKPGQSSHALVLDIFKTHSRPDVLSPSVYESLKNSKYQAAKGWIKKGEVQMQYDMNKCYLSILQTFNFPLLSVENDLMPYNGESININYYYEISKLCMFASHLYLNGKYELYPACMINDALLRGYITNTDISRVLIPKETRPSFNPIIDKLIEQFGLKEANNILRKVIGLMRISGEKHIKKIINSTDMNELMIFAKGDITKIGRVIFEKEYTQFEETKFVALENIADDNAGILSYIYESTDYTLCNYSFIQNMILKLAQFKVAQHALNVTTQEHILAINVDSFAVDKIINEPILSDVIGGIKRDFKTYTFDFNIRLPEIVAQNENKIKNIDCADAINHAINNGLMLHGRAGSGKSYMGNEIYKEAVVLSKKCLFTAPYHSVVEKLRKDVCQGRLKTNSDDVPILTIDSLLGLADNDNVEDKRYLLKNIDIVFVDEFMVCKRHHLRLLYENKLRYGFKVVLMGHFSQGAPFGETALPYTNSVYMALVNYNLLLLNENKRCEDTELNAEQDKIDQYVIKNGDYKSYPHEETKKVLALLNHGESRRNIAYHIDVVEKVNQHYIKKESALADKVIQGLKYKYYVGMPIMSTKNETKYKNGQVFFIGLITALSNGGSSSHEKILLFSGFDPSEGMEESIEVTKRQLFDFVPAYCITSFKARGQTIRAPHTIWEYDLKNLPANDLYIMISRSTLREHILLSI